jgi:hypothetical protein
VPALLALWVLERWVAPVFRITRPDADPHYASLVSGMTTARAEDAATIRLLAPEDGAALDAPPTFRWEPPPGAPPGARYTVHALAANGRLIGGTFEMGGIELAGGEWACPQQFWDVIPIAEPALWKVRRLPDRRAGESVADTDESVVRRFTRLR